MGNASRAAIVSDRRITDLSASVVAELVAEVGPLWHQRHRAKLASRARKRAVGASAEHRLVFVDRLLVASLEPEGVSVRECNAHMAARVALWLRDDVAPADVPVMFNTDWGIEEGLEPVLVPEATRPRIVAALVQHVEETGGLD